MSQERIEEDKALEVSLVIADKFVKKSYKKKMLILYVIACVMIEALTAVAIKTLPIMLETVTNSMDETLGIFEWDNKEDLSEIDSEVDEFGKEMTSISSEFILQGNEDNTKRIREVIIKFILLMAVAVNYAVDIFQIIEFAICAWIAVMPNYIRRKIEWYVNNPMYTKDKAAMRYVSTHRSILKASESMSQLEKITYLIIMAIPVIISLCI